MLKKLRKLILYYFFSGKVRTFLFLLFAIFTLLFITKTNNQVLADMLLYTETFSAPATYKDTANTNTNWDTANSRGQLFGKEWVNMAETAKGFEVAASSADSKLNAQIKIGTNNNPYLVWEESVGGGANDVMFSKWTPGIGWTTMDGTPGYENLSNNLGFSVFPKIVLDTNNNPNIVWGDNTNGSFETLFTKWTPGIGWTDMSGVLGNETLQFLNEFPDIILDAANQPYVVSFNNNAVAFTRWLNGSGWVDMNGDPFAESISVPGVGALYPRILFNSLGLPSIVLFTNNRVYFTQWSVGIAPGICDGSDLSIVNCWTDIAQASPGTEAVSLGGVTMQPVEFLIASNDDVLVAWEALNGGTKDIYFSRGIPGNGWFQMDGVTPGFENISNVAGTSEKVKLGITSGDNPYLVWQDNELGDYDIYFKRWNGSAWVRMNGAGGNDNILNNLGISENAFIVIDSLDNAYVVWSDNSAGNYDVLFSKGTPGSGWLKLDDTAGYQTLLGTGTFESAQNIAISSDDKVFVLSGNNTNAILSITKVLPKYQPSAQLQSLNINDTGPGDYITSVKINPSETLSGQSINYFLSNDGGSTWESVAKLTWHEFSSQGNDLRWRAVLNSVNGSATPLLDTLAINFQTQKMICSLSNTTVVAGNQLTVYATLNFNPGTVIAQVKNNATLLDTVTLTTTDLAPPYNYSGQIQTNSTNIGQNNVTVLAEDITTNNTRACRPSTGINWEKLTVNDVNILERYKTEGLVFNNKMWLLGGYYNTYDSRIWNSSDGLNWEAKADGPWTPRIEYSVADYNGSMYVMGGERAVGGVITPNPDTVWSSNDGTTWNSVAAPWSARFATSTAVYGTKLWLFGGCSAWSNLKCTTINHEIWSYDGTNWVCEAGSAPGCVNPAPAWPKRIGQTVFKFDDGTGLKLYLTGGSDYYSTCLIGGGLCNSNADCAGVGNRCVGNPNFYKDSWWSSNGATWQNTFCQGGTNDGQTCLLNSDCVSNNCGVQTADFHPARHLYRAVSLNNKIWLMVGSDSTCSAGANIGNPCIWASDCPGGSCVNNVYNDIYSTSNGTDWTLDIDPVDTYPKPSAPSVWQNWSARGSSTILGFDGKVWVIGGINYRGTLNEVWYSSDPGNLLGWHLIGKDPNNPSYDGIFGDRFDPSIVSYKNKLWIMGSYVDGAPPLSNDVWSSPDGVTWTCEIGDYTDPVNGFHCNHPTSDFTPYWSPRIAHDLVVFNDPLDSQDKIFLIGGCDSYAGGGLSCPLANRKQDVWAYDGNTWVLKKDPAAWSGRYMPAVTVYNNQIWLIGGYTGAFLKDVYSSSDGITWNLVAAAPAFAGRYMHSVIPYNDGTGEKLYLMGGWSGGRRNDVWSSSNGILWSQNTAAAAWTPRYTFGLLNYDNKMWVISGNGINFPSLDNRDAWWSVDGTNWYSVTTNTEFIGRDFFGATVHNDRMVIVGGDTNAGVTNEVWASKYGNLIFNVTGARPLPPGNGGTAPVAPINLHCQALSPTSISWQFTDMANDETGFKLFSDQGLIYDSGPEIVSDLSEIIEENKDVNSLYANRYVKAYNSNGDSASSNLASCYTLANIPQALTLGEVSGNLVRLIIGSQTNNASNTKFAIIETTTGKYVQADGSLADTPFWQTTSEWGGTNGFWVTTVPGQIPQNTQPGNLNTQNNIDVTYSFAVKAQNGNDIATDNSTPLIVTVSQPEVVPEKVLLQAIKGVGINVNQTQVYNSAFLKTALAKELLIKTIPAQQSQWVSWLKKFSWLLNFILLALVILLSFNLYNSFRHLKKDSNCYRCLRLLWIILISEPAKAFEQYAEKDEHGIFKISFHKHQQLHLFTRQTLLRTIGVLALKVLVLVIILFSFVGLKYQGLAQQAPFDQDGQIVSVGDQLSYVIEINNLGTTLAKNISLTDGLSSGLTYIADSATINIDGVTKSEGISFNNNILNFAFGDLNPGQSGYVIFTAEVNPGTELTTIQNQASLKGDNFVSFSTNMTSNSVEAAEVLPTCGDGQKAVTEICDQSAASTGCAANEICSNCTVCQIVPENLCGNGQIDSGEACDQQAVPNGCSENQRCQNCACSEIVEEPIEPETPPVIIPEPPIIPPITPTPPGTEVPGSGTITEETGIINEISQVFETLFAQILDNPVNVFLAENFYDNPQVEKASQNVVTPLLIIFAALNTLPSAILITANILPYLHLVFFEPLLLFFRRKRKKWGVVYDSLTKVPIGLAVVRLFSQPDNRLVQTKVTDKDGRYQFIVKDKGTYYLSLLKPGYEFPTRFLGGEKQDTKYIDLYHGEKIEVTEENAVITANIPVDFKEQKVLRANEVIRNYVFGNLRLLISYLGLILAVIVFLIYPTAITVASIFIHVVMFIIFRSILVPPKPKSWGIVYDSDTKEPLSYSIVRIFDTKFNKLLETQVTDSKGRYSFLVSKNVYQLSAEKAGYVKKEVKPIDLVKKETIVNLDLGLAKEK